MTSQTLGLVVGGLIPALFFGLSGVFAKYAANAGVTPSLYLFTVGLSVAVAGAGFYVFESDPEISLRSAVYSFLAGLVWALGAGLLAFALVKFQSPISKLVPLYNTNTLVAVILGLWLFAEWREVSISQLLIGAFLIVLGGVLVSNA